MPINSYRPTISKTIWVPRREWVLWLQWGSSPNNIYMLHNPWIAKTTTWSRCPQTKWWFKILACNNLLRTVCLLGGINIKDSTTRLWIARWWTTTLLGQDMRETAAYLLSTWIGLSSRRMVKPLWINLSRSSQGCPDIHLRWKNSRRTSLEKVWAEEAVQLSLTRES